MFSIGEAYDLNQFVYFLSPAYLRMCYYVLELCHLGQTERGEGSFQIMYLEGLERVWFFLTQ